MTLVIIGLNHQSAPVALREQLAFVDDELPAALVSIQQLACVRSAALVSTCNRTELYADICEADTATLISWLHDWHQLPAQSLDAHLYCHIDAEAVRHAFRVASGLDSMVLGEPQILGQLKTAYSQAINAHTLSKPLGRLFQHSFTVAKQVRTDTAIGSSPVSIAFAAVSLAKRIFTELPTATALLIGAGETIELTARHLIDQGVRQFIIANRTVERAQQLADSLGSGGYAISLSELPEHLHRADILISATASQLPILGKGAVENALKQRKRRPVFMVDIAVPRDIEPEVAALADVYLYSVDDLHDIIEQGRQSRREAAAQAEDIVSQQVTHFIGWQQSQAAVPTIHALRGKLEAERDILLKKAQKQIAQGQAADTVLAEFSRCLTQKLLHAPSQQLREASYNGDNSLVDAARTLFDIQEDPEQ